MIFDDDPMERIEKLADDILNGASQYQVIVELGKLNEPMSDDDIEYKNFLLSVLATFEDESGYEH